MDTFFHHLGQQQHAETECRFKPDYFKRSSFCIAIFVAIVLGGSPAFADTLTFTQFNQFWSEVSVRQRDAAGDEQGEKADKIVELNQGSRTSDCREGGFLEGCRSETLDSNFGYTSLSAINGASSLDVANFGSSASLSITKQPNNFTMFNLLSSSPANYGDHSIASTGIEFIYNFNANSHNRYFQIAPTIGSHSGLQETSLQFNLSVLGQDSFFSQQFSLTDTSNIFLSGQTIDLFQFVDPGETLSLSVTARAIAYSSGIEGNPIIYGAPQNASLAFGFSMPENSAPVPEPATMLLFGTGLAGLAAVRRRKKS